MGQQPKKYHIANDGSIYKVNDDGSFTLVGNIDDIDKLHSKSSVDAISSKSASIGKTSDNINKGWLKRNYNWLWLTTLVIFIGWFISCLSCSCPNYPIYEGGYIVNYYYVDNFGEIFGVSVVVLICFILSWRFSLKGKWLYKFSQILLVACCGWIASSVYWLCEQQYSFLLLCLAAFPFILWIITICVSLFSNKRV